MRYFRLSPRALAIALVTVAALVMSPLETVAGSTALTPPSDAAATRIYLKASYAWARSLVANAPASEASVRAFARKVEHECPGVAQNAYGKAVQTVSGEGPGKATRRIWQDGMDLSAEIEAAVELKAVAPDRPALTRLLGAIAPLRWRDQKVTRWIRVDVLEAWRLAVKAPLDVCSDMRSWVASGYARLSAATSSFDSRRQAFEKEFRGTLVGYAELRRYQRRHDEVLLRRIRRLLPGIAAEQKAKRKAIASLDRELGLPLGPAAR